MKKRVKKLVLNKETLRNLSENELQKAAGGDTTTPCFSPPRVCTPLCTVTRCTGCCSP